MAPLAARKNPKRTTRILGPPGLVRARTNVRIPSKITAMKSPSIGQPELTVRVCSLLILPPLFTIS